MLYRAEDGGEPAPRSPEATSICLKLTGLRLGYLLNFGGALMKDGVIRIVNGLPDGMASLAALASWREENNVIFPRHGGATIRRHRDDALDPAGGKG